MRSHKQHQREGRKARRVTEGRAGRNKVRGENLLASYTSMKCLIIGRNKNSVKYYIFGSFLSSVII
jgi:hypothetical protein